MSNKILFSIAASQNFYIERMDVETAFVNSPINEEVYVEQPYGLKVIDTEDEKRLKD